MGQRVGISCKGFGRKNIKDKAIAKRHLLALAIENLDTAASDFGGDQGMVQEEKKPFAVSSGGNVRG